MGLVWDQAESQSFQSQLRTNLEAWERALSQWKRRIDELSARLGSGELSSQAYNAVKSLFIDRILPIVTTGQSACYWTRIHLYEYAAAEIPLLDDGGHVNEDYLQTSVDYFSDEIYDMTHAWFFYEFWKVDDPEVVRLQKSLDSMNEKLTDLRTFSASVSGLFSGEISLTASLASAILSINKGTLSANGSYVPSSGDDESWLQMVKDYGNNHQIDPSTDAAKIADWVNGLHGDKVTEVPPELLALMEANEGNPEFAFALAQSIPAAQLTGMLSGLGEHAAELAFDYDPGLDDYYAYENHVLCLFADALSHGASLMTESQLDAFTKDWCSVVSVRGSDPHASMASLLIARGAWPDSFLTQAADAIIAFEPFGVIPPVNIFDPAANPDTGEHDQIGDPLAGIFQSAATFSPKWMLDYFTSGHTVDLDLPGYDYEDGKHADAMTVSVDSKLNDFLNTYDMDGASSYWFGQAAANASLYDYSFQGGTDFAAGLTAIVELSERNKEIYDHLPPWDKYKHQIMAGLGIALFIGTLIAAPYASPAVMTTLLLTDAGVALTDAVLYALDGDWTNAAIAAAFVLVPIGVGAGVKWIRMSRAELELVQAGGRVGDVTQESIQAGLAQTSGSIQTRISEVLNIEIDSTYDIGHVLSSEELETIRRGNYSMAWFDDVSKSAYYDVPEPTLGAPGKPFFVMPVEDGQLIETAYDAARYTGMSPSTYRAAYETPQITGRTGDIYAILFPQNKIPIRQPTVEDASGWEHFLPGGRTAVRLPGENGYLVNPTREYVIPGGTAIPEGSMLVKLGEDGELIVVRRF